MILMGVVLGLEMVDLGADTNIPSHNGVCSPFCPFYHLSFCVKKYCLLIGQTNTQPHQENKRRLKNENESNILAKNRRGFGKK